MNQATLAERLLAFSLCVLFVIIASPWIAKPGIQTDEALFGAGIYPPFSQDAVVRAFGREFPLMIMTYVGTLKASIWSMVFKVWPPSPASVRIPAILLGALSIFLVYLLITRLGSRAALGATALLATDPLYVIYSRIDHGPVVIQHVCLAAAMLALVRFHEGSRRIWLAAGFFALGLGLWEKALFSWLIGGLAVAGIVVFWRHLLSARSLRNVVVASTAFVVGALPLIVYNLRNGFATFRGNTEWSTEAVVFKAQVLGRTLDGQALFGWLVRESSDTPSHPPFGAQEKAVVSIADAAGLPRRSLMGVLALAAVVLLPVVWRTRARSPALFMLIAVSVAWLMMAFNKNTGFSTHHTVLLWPLPTIGIAAVIASASEKLRRGHLLFTGVIVVAMAANLLVLSSYYTHLLRDGATPSWSDAMYPAFDAIREMDKSAICTIDWGFTETLRLLEQDGRHLCGAVDPVDDETRRVALSQISQTGFVFLTHTPGNESFAGRTDRFVQFAEGSGFRRVNHRVFEDSNGYKTVEIFRFAPALQNGSVSPQRAVN